MKRQADLVAWCLFVLGFFAWPLTAIGGEFVVFDATLYTHKPDLAQEGFRPIAMIYQSDLWPDGQDLQSLPSNRNLAIVARRVPRLAEYIVLDVEHWPVRDSDGDVRFGIGMYQSLIAKFKENAPDHKVGYYGVPPLIDYWRAIQPVSDPRRLHLRNENDRLKPLVEQVDALFPSLYTFYEDRPGWREFARSQLLEARRIANGRPIFVFLWPQYHDSNQLLRGKYLPASYWRMELDTVRELADGIVVWGGWGKNGPDRWNPNAMWWRETRSFIQSLRQ